MRLLANDLVKQAILGYPTLLNSPLVNQLISLLVCFLGCPAFAFRALLAGLLRALTWVSPRVVEQLGHNAISRINVGFLRSVTGRWHQQFFLRNNICRLLLIVQFFSFRSYCASLGLLLVFCLGIHVSRSNPNIYLFEGFSFC